MIKAEHLRIGNKFHGIAGVQTVFAILDNTDRGKIKQSGYEHLILCKENGNQYKPIEIEGIPVTKEWLLSNGFTKLNNGWDLGDFGLYDCSLGQLSQLKYNGSEICPEVKYVH